MVFISISAIKWLYHWFIMDISWPCGHRQPLRVSYSSVTFILTDGCTLACTVSYHIHQSMYWRSNIILRLNVPLTLTPVRDLLVYNCIMTNKKLCKMKIINNDKCSFCNDLTEDMKHLFWECKCVQNIWNAVNNWSQTYLKLNIDLNYKRILFVDGTDFLLMGLTCI